MHGAISFLIAYMTAAFLRLETEFNWLFLLKNENFTIFQTFYSLIGQLNWKIQKKNSKFSENLNNNNNPNRFVKSPFYCGKSSFWIKVCPAWFQRSGLLRTVFSLIWKVSGLVRKCVLISKVSNWTWKWCDEWVEVSCKIRISISVGRRPTKIDILPGRSRSCRRLWTRAEKTFAKIVVNYCSK